MLLRVLVLIIVTAGVLAVDRSNFRTCEQTGYCRRNRNQDPGSWAFEAKLQSLDLSSTRARVDVVNVNNSIKFHLIITAQPDNSVRLKLVEQVPVRVRYEPPVGDVLVADPPTEPLQLAKQDDDVVVLKFLNNELHIVAQPFRVEVMADGDLVATLNADGRLRYETSHTLPQLAEGEEGGNDYDGIGSEMFKSHEDTKPNGAESLGVDINLVGFSHAYGLPEHADSFVLKSTRDTDPYRLYNLDVFEYELHNPMALYGSVPYLWAHSEKRTVGVFWLNPSETWVDVRYSNADKNVLSRWASAVLGAAEVPQVQTHWISETGALDVFLLLGPKPSDVSSQYAGLTGTTPLPPLFSIAYHQCRWNYNDMADVAEVHGNFDKHQIPMDVIWLDIEHTDGKRYFTWDSHRFPDPDKMLEDLKAKGRKLVTIVDPHLKRDSNYPVYSEAQSNNYFVMDKNNNEFDGWCWPGSSSWNDFLDPTVRTWWADLFKTYRGCGAGCYTWNDMNEPSVFSGPEVTMHKDAIHLNGHEHREVHNVYGLYQHRATSEGHTARSDGKDRPFVLTRAFFAGSQRYSAVWTGDNAAEWGHLKISVPMLLSLGITGITFSGADVGGFFHNPEEELVLRWYQTASWQPFFRAHAHLDTRRREPWLLSPNGLEIVRTAIQERYSYLPMWYTLFYESSLTGAPVMRPLYFNFPSDSQTFNEEHSFMVGSAMLVHPVLDQGVYSVSLYLPVGVWYDIHTHKKYAGGMSHTITSALEQVVVLQRGGTGVARRMRQRRSSAATHSDPVTLVFAMDERQSGVGTLFIDQYDGFAYKDGNYVYREFDIADGTIISKKADSKGQSDTDVVIERIQVVGLTAKPQHVMMQFPSQEKLRFDYDDAKNVLTIKKPMLNVAKDFIIKLHN